MASAKPATMPDGSAAGVVDTIDDDAGGADRDARRRPARRASPSAAAALSPVPGPEHRTAVAGPRRLGRAEHPRDDGGRPSARSSRSGRYSPGGRRPVAGAAGVAAVGDAARRAPAAPASRQVSQSCGRQTAAVRAAFVRLVLGQPAQLGDGERGDRAPARPRRPTPPAGSPPPSSSIRSVAAPADRVSFHSSAGRTTSPSVVEADHAVLLPADGDAPRRRPARRPASSACCERSHHAAGSTSVPSGCGARPSRTRRAGRRRPGPRPCRPGSTSRPRRRASSRRHGQRAPSRCSTASWSSRTKP